MFERNISPDIAADIAANGEMIASYPSDKPFPSVLALGFQKERPIHIVVARNVAENECYIVTVYEPNPEQWTDDFRRKRRL
jgi:hypothetical protein